MKFISLVLLLGLAISINSCGDKPHNDCGNLPLTFDLPLQAYGIKDTLNLGDTIHIILEVPEKMAERSSGISYDFIDYDFKLITYMVRIDTLPTLSATYRFDWLMLKGESKPVKDVFIVLPDYHDHIYHYEVLIIAREKGLYNFGMNSDAGRLNPLEKLDGPCAKNGVEVYMKLVNNIDPNFEFMQFSPDVAQINVSRQRFDEYAGFCFFVR